MQIPGSAFTDSDLVVVGKAMQYRVKFNFENRGLGFLINLQ